MQNKEKKLTFKRMSDDEVRSLLLVMTKLFEECVDKCFNHSFYIAYNEYCEIHYAINQDMEMLIKRITTRYKHPYSLGLFIGWKRNEKFIPTPWLFSYVYGCLGKIKAAIQINEKASYLYLYGRDIFASSIMKIYEPIKEGNYVAVLDYEGEIIGVGLLLKSPLKAEGNEVVVKNVFDMGWFLRRGG
ncbi:MAG: hypothetical protein DRO15_01805 [Thermoprotei archaeon]|nr:MAG: hypothetical protein DRO15_01805 [Thermoprotei archaeon]